MAFTPLELAKIPDTHSMRLLSTYWKGSLTSDKHLQRQLRLGQENLLSDSWKGDGANAYGQANEHLMTRGNLHHSQGEQAGNMLAWTADQFDEAQRLQDWAKEQWEYAKKAEEAGQPELAISYYTGAQTTQARVLSIIETTRGHFRDTFKRLTEELDGLPPLEELDLTNPIPDSSPTMPKDSPPLENAPGFTADYDSPSTGQNPATPDTKQNPFPSDNTPAFLTFDTDQKSATPDTKQNPINPDTKQNPFPSDNTPAFIAFDTDQKSVTPDTKQNLINPDTKQNPFPSDNTPAFIAFDTDQNPIALSNTQNPLTPDNRPNPMTHDDLYNPINTETTQNLFTSDLFKAGTLHHEPENAGEISASTAIFEQYMTALAQNPQAGTSKGSRITQPLNITGVMYSLLPQNPLAQALQSTPEGAKALSDEQTLKVSLILVPGQGSEYHPGSNTAYLGADLPFAQLQEKYIHELKHAQDALTNGVIDPRTIDTSEEYARIMLNKEAEAEAPAIRHHLRSHAYIPSNALEETYWNAYKQSLDAAQISHPSGRHEPWHEAGLSQAKEALVTALKGETVTISTGNVGYEEYYKIQHQRALDGLTTTVINPAPGTPPGSEQMTLASTDSQGQEERQLLSRLRSSSDLLTTEEGKRALDLQEQHGVLLRIGSMPGAEVQGEASYDQDTNTAYLGLGSDSSRKQRDAAFVQAMTYVRIAHDPTYASTPSGQNQQAIPRVDWPLWPRSYATPQEYTQARLWQDVLVREESMNYALRLEQEDRKAWEAQKVLDLKKFIGLKELYELQEKKWESNLVLLEHQRVYIEALNEAALKKYAHLSNMDERLLKALEDARNALSAFLSTERVTLTSEDRDSEAAMMRSTYYRRYWNRKNQEGFIKDTHAITGKDLRIPLFTSYSISQAKRTIDEIEELIDVPGKTYKFAKITEETSIGISSIGESRDNSAENTPLIPRKTVHQPEGANIAKTTGLGTSSARKQTRSNPGKYTWEAKGDKTKVTPIPRTTLPEGAQPSTAEFFAAPESENVVASFYQGIKKGYDKLVSKIEGIPTKADKMGNKVPGDRERYASLTLNRLAFLTFIQEKRFLNGDPKYLQNQLKQMRTLDGRDGTSYQSFLSKLFRALNAPFASSERADELGQVPSLKNDLFAVHQLERQYPEVKIPNKAYASLFRSFAQYHWHLDEDFEPLGADIDPETFSFGFEQLVGQKEMGAYYTSKDVTEYIGNKAILPSLFDKLAESFPDVLSPDGPVLSLLQKNFADYTYGIDAKREAKEKIEGISDLITYNLDSGKLAEDFITDCSRPDVLLAFYTSLTATTVLDPTCGTGAFLCAASRFLSPLYLACLTRMQVLADTYDQHALRGELQEQQAEQLKDMRKILQQRGNVPLRYFILKSIITRNLYGVDLMEGAVETCKFSLSLKLLAQVDNPADWDGEEALSTDLLNVFAGNALVETAFDWKKHFPQVMRHGKFDVIIGNPPYVAYNAEQFAATAGYTLSRQSFQTLDCRNLYAYVVEKSRRELLAPTGYMGMIIPLAAFSTSTMTPLLDRFYRWFPRSWVSFFHANPSSLFDGGKGARVLTAIFLGHAKQTQEVQRFSTTLIRWRAPERDQLLSRLVYCPVTVERDPHNTFYYPKFGDPIENSIMQKIRRHKRVGKYLTTQAAGQEQGQKIWYRSAGGDSWKIFLNYAWPLPSATNQALSVQPGLDYERDIFVALFNSTLFFWYYTSTTNAFDVSTYALLGFRFAYPKEDAIFEGDTTILQALRSCTTRLMAEYKENAEKVVVRGKKVYKVYAAPSKDIIDEIDTILAKHYRLTDQERDFILNYNSEFRSKPGTVWRRKYRRAKQPAFEQVMTDSSESGQTSGGDSQLSHRQEAAAVNPVAVVEDKKRLAKLRDELEKAENDIQAAEERFGINAQRTMKLRNDAIKLTNAVRALERQIGSPSESSAGSLRDIQGEVSEAEPVLSTAPESQEPQPRKRKISYSGTESSVEIQEPQPRKRKIIIESSSSETESSVEIQKPQTRKRKTSKPSEVGRSVKIQEPQTRKRRIIIESSSSEAESSVKLQKTQKRKRRIIIKSSSSGEESSVKPHNPQKRKRKNSTSFDMERGVKLLTSVSPTHLAEEEQEVKRKSYGKPVKIEDVYIRIKNLKRLIKNKETSIASIDSEKNPEKLKQANRTLSTYKWEHKRLLKDAKNAPEEAIKREEQRLITNRNFKYKDKEKEAARNKRRAEQKKQWKMNNRERVRATTRAWQSRNRERVNEHSRAWKRKNRERVNKQQESLQDNPTPERKTPDIIQPSPVETLPPPTPLTTDKGYLRADEKLRHAEPFRWVDVTGQLSQNLDDPFVRDLQRTEMGRLALQVEREHGGKLFLTNGTASFHYEGTTVIGLGPKFTLSARFAQRRWIHEKMHQLLRALNPLKYTQKEYVELMLQEEAYVESCGIDHMRELGPERPLTLSDSIYIEAFDQGYRDMKMIKLWATEEELRAYGRQRGMEALLQALKDKVLVPSTVPQDLSRSKEQLYGYEEYYADSWHKVRAGQEAAVVNPGPAIEADPASRPAEMTEKLTSKNT